MCLSASVFFLFYASLYYRLTWEKEIADLRVEMETLCRQAEQANQTALQDEVQSNFLCFPEIVQVFNAYLCVCFCVCL